MTYVAFKAHIWSAHASPGNRTHDFVVASAMFEQQEYLHSKCSSISCVNLLSLTPYHGIYSTGYTRITHTHTQFSRFVIICFIWKVSILPRDKEGKEAFVVWLWAEDATERSRQTPRMRGDEKHTWLRLLRGVYSVGTPEEMHRRTWENETDMICLTGTCWERRMSWKKRAEWRKRKRVGGAYSPHVWVSQTCCFVLISW